MMMVQDDFSLFDKGFIFRKMFDKLGIQGGLVPIEIDGEEFLAGGDIILAVNGITVEGPQSTEVIRQSFNKTDTSMSVIVYRNGQVVKLNPL